MNTKNTLTSWGFDLSDLDTTASPAEDFFQYAAGGWQKKNSIPATEAQWGAFDLLREENRTKLHAILEEVRADKKATQGTHRALLRDFYNSGMDEAGREKAGIKPLAHELKRIESIKKSADVVPAIGALHKSGFGVLWGMSVEQDEKKSDQHITYFSQDGLSLPDRDYYLKDDTDSKKIRETFKKYTLALWALFGKDKKTAEKNFEIVMRVETRLAKASMTRVELRDVEKQYNKRTLKTLQKETPEISWGEYFSVVGLKGKKVPSEFIVRQVDFLKESSMMLKEIPMEDWKIYFLWHVLDGAAPLLTKAFVQASFDFHVKALTGTKEMKPLWKRVLGMTDACLGDALGKEYVARHFSPKASKKINELVDNLFVVFRDRVKKLDWMSTATKKKALAKLALMARKLGYPKKWKTYKGLVITPDSYFRNIQSVHDFEFKRMLAKLGKKIDRNEWHMTAPTVNAYYHPNMNEIAFPAGIMQPPFFDPDADDALNYGAIGSVIGHEITHGFDDEGSKFDGKGNFHEWWTKEDRKKFEAKTKILVKQYNGYEVVDGMHINGELTLGENIADLGGLVVALEAYKKSLKGKPGKILDNFTPEQRFFLGFTRSERDNIRPELAKKYVIVDPHSPSRFRVIGPLANMEEFHKAFGVKPGDKMYRGPKERAEIW